MIIKFIRDYKLQLIIGGLLLIFFVTFCTGCDRSKPATPPDPVEVLREQVESERELRTDAQSKASREETLRRRWEVATVTVGLAAVAAFLIGTMLGSWAKRHASDHETN